MLQSLCSREGDTEDEDEDGEDVEDVEDRGYPLKHAVNLKSTKERVGQTADE